jgi:large subunit ribosomal protein L15
MMMFQLHNLESLTKKRKRVGRGGSRGGTSGRGHKGQRSRTGGKSGLNAFEGGQMPLSRRLPKRGFNNIFKKDFQIVSLKDLEIKFADGDTVNKESLLGSGLIKDRKGSLIKILANGTLSKKLVICADAFSKTAFEAIKNAGGEAKSIKEIERGSIAS